MAAAPQGRSWGAERAMVTYGRADGASPKPDLLVGRSERGPSQPGDGSVLRMARVCSGKWALQPPTTPMWVTGGMAGSRCEARPSVGDARGRAVPGVWKLIRLISTGSLGWWGARSALLSRHFVRGSESFRLLGDARGTEGHGEIGAGNGPWAQPTPSPVGGQEDRAGSHLSGLLLPGVSRHRKEGRKKPR